MCNWQYCMQYEVKSQDVYISKEELVKSPVNEWKALQRSNMLMRKLSTSQVLAESLDYL